MKKILIFTIAMLAALVSFAQADTCLVTIDYTNATCYQAAPNEVTLTLYAADAVTVVDQMIVAYAGGNPVGTPTSNLGYIIWDGVLNPGSFSDAFVSAPEGSYILSTIVEDVCAGGALQTGSEQSTPVKFDCQPVKQLIPSPWFADSNNPLLSEVEAFAIQIYGGCPCDGSIFWQAGGGGSIDFPQFSWICNGADFSNVQYENQCLNIPNSAFSDVDNPTNDEAVAYMTSISTHVGQHFCFGGIARDPDYVWVFEGNNAGYLIEEPTQVIEHNIQTTIISDTTQLVCIVDDAMNIIGNCDTIFCLLSCEIEPRYSIDSAYVFDVQICSGLNGVVSEDTIKIACNNCLDPVYTLEGYQEQSNDSLLFYTVLYKDGIATDTTLSGCKIVACPEYEVGSLALNYLNRDSAFFSIVPSTLTKDGGDLSATDMIKVTLKETDGTIMETLTGNITNTDINSYTSVLGSASVGAQTNNITDNVNPLDSFVISKFAHSSLNSYVGVTNEQATQICYSVCDADGVCISNEECVSLPFFDTYTFDNQTQTESSSVFLPWDASQTTGETIGSLSRTNHPNTTQVLGAGCVDTRRPRNCDPRDSNGNPIQTYNNYTFNGVTQLYTGSEIIGDGSQAGPHPNTIANFVAFIREVYMNESGVEIGINVPFVWYPDFDSCDDGTGTQNRYLGFYAINVPRSAGHLEEFCFQQCGTDPTSIYVNGAQTIEGELCIETEYHPLRSY